MIIPYRPRLATAIPNQKRNRAKQKSMSRVRDEGGHGTAEAEEHAPQRVLERMPSRDGIRRGA